MGIPTGIRRISIGDEVLNVFALGTLPWRRTPLSHFCEETRQCNHRAVQFRELAGLIIRYRSVRLRPALPLQTMNRNNIEKHAYYSVLASIT